jgi:hypothetical protein
MKVSQKQFEYFKESFIKWQNILNMNDWQVYFVMKDTKSDCFAQVKYDTVSRLAKVILNDNVYGDDIKFLDPVKHGKHEAMHLFLASLTGYADERFVSKEEINKENERLVVLLVKLIKE